MRSFCIGTRLSQTILQNPVTVLRGVGEKMASRLSDIGIRSLEDLLFHFPLRYQDRTQITPIGGLRDHVDAVIDGEVLTAAVTLGRRRTLLIKIEDGTGILTVRLFHFRQAQVSQFKQGAAIQLFGTPRRSGGHIEMIHPEYRLGEGANLVEQALTPVYPTVSGMGQSTWRKLCGQALRLLVANPPEDLLATVTEDAITLSEAIAFLHNPPPGAELNQIHQGLHPAQLRLAREELIAHQLTVQGVRDRERRHTAPVIAGLSPLSEKLLAQLPFSPTAAQERVASELALDMSQQQPMLRLVQGDVGSGKTLVAARAALDTLASGYQVAFMAPTELLAEQHFANLEAWFSPMGLPVAWLSGRTKGKARAATLSELASGDAHIVVGTHALFQQDVQFRRLGLIIVDEQHRFGVHQRLALADKGAAGQHPHQLALTATPIPRSLAMVAYGDLDCSVIDELPPGRQPVMTTLIEHSRRDAVIRRVGVACREGRQAYWVCTAIEENDTLDIEAAEATYKHLCHTLPEASIGLVHGKLKPAEKAAVMERFKQGEIQLLIATTVIEVGMDVPNASLMIIDNAERLGLAQLHQLRGRVGRGAIDSHCLLLFRQPLSETAQQRLSIMQESHDGFVIAEADLAIRGPGELLGTRQTGLAAFRIALLPEHEALLVEAQAVATRLYQHDPARAEALMRRWAGSRADFARV
ncbi:MAG: ATP-dependent DNA helicase RecG [Luminiphilus sp.]|nr:ATP-dependent DNA helicase RecG [Luminiphilus sp.]